MLNDRRTSSVGVAVTERILITGGAGYIGSHVVKALGERGLDVMTYDNLSTGHRDAVLSGEFVQGDLADTQLLEKTLRGFSPSAVMHFAALIVVGDSVRYPLRYYANNASDTVNLLNAMARSGVEQFVFSSTAAVYGIPDRTPIAESAPLRPINPYGNAKAFVETVLADLAAAGTLRSVSLRYFNAAGADPAGGIGERHEPETHLIPLALQAARGARNGISIYGEDYPTPDGTCIRDYIHVEDLVDAHLLALDHLRRGGESDVFNCGYGHGYSVREVIDAVRRATGRDITVGHAARRPGDPPVLVADSGKLKRLLGWTPRHDDLDYIVRTAWVWEQKRS